MAYKPPPVDDTTPLVRDPADRTKKVRLDAGAVATATTRVITMPDADVDLSLVGGSFMGAGAANTPVFTGDTTGTLGVGLKAYFPAKESGKIYVTGNADLHDVINDRVLRASTNTTLTTSAKAEGLLHGAPSTVYWIDATEDDFWPKGDMTFTLAMWMKTGAGFTGSNRHLITDMNSDNTTTRWYLVYWAADNYLYAAMYDPNDANTNVAYTGGTMANSTEYLVAIKYAVSGDLLGCSLNGGAWATTVQASGLGMGTDTVTDQLQVCGYGLANMPDMSVGAIALWTTALSDAQIAAYWNAGSGVQIVRHI